MVRFLLVVLITSSECCFASEKSDNCGAIMFCKNKKIVCALSELTTLIFTKCRLAVPVLPVGHSVCVLTMCANMPPVSPIGMLPVRLVSLESLVDGVLAAKSDVWSLGVTLWELATFGSFPYQGFSNGEVVEKVKQGHVKDVLVNCMYLP